MIDTSDLISGDEYLERMYEAYWQEQKDRSELSNKIVIDNDVWNNMIKYY